MTYWGEIAALSAAMCWTLGAQTIEAASNRVGAFTVNMTRLMVAVSTIGLFLFIRDGSILPTGMTTTDIGWLIASGFIGVMIGDMCLFAAFVEIGPRLSMLIMSVSAPASALIAYLMLGEHYGLAQWAGMFVTVGGVALVIMEKPPVLDETGHRKFRHISAKGFLFAMGGMLGQAFGAVLSKLGMGDADFVHATQIRLWAAMVGMMIFFTIRGWWPRVLKAVKQPKIMGLIAFGGIVGTSCGIGLSMKAFQLIHVGLAGTLLSLVPIFLIPFAVFLHKEHVSYRAIIGTFVAFGGICIMMLIGGSSN